MFKQNSKGFFFVLITFIILGYILTSVSLWTKSVDVSEKKFADKFKFSNLEVVAEEVSERSIRKFSQLAAYKALSYLNDQSVSTPLKRDSKDETKYFSSAFEGLFKEGVAKAENFESGPDSDTTEIIYSGGQGLSFNDWKEDLNSAINPLGLNLTRYEFSNFGISQRDYKTLNYSFTLEIEIQDRSNLATIHKTLLIQDNLSIQGLKDPSLMRYTKGSTLGKEIEKQFFFNPDYADESKEKPSSKLHAMDLGERLGKPAAEAQGWFYGTLVPVELLKARPDAISVFDYNSSILVGTYEEISSYENYEQFGAYLLTNKIDETGSCAEVKTQSNTFNAIEVSDCSAKKFIIKSDTFTSRPFIVIPGFDYSKALDTFGEQYYPENEKQARLLFKSSVTPDDVRKDPEVKANSKPRYFYIEKLRDFAVCGYYSTNSNAPSYIQRLFGNGHTLKGGKFGIDSFAFGTWVGGSDPEALQDELSRLDWELEDNNQDTEIIIGMPGCKNKEMCTSEDSFIGHFRISENSTSDYLGKESQELICDGELC